MAFLLFTSIASIAQLGRTNIGTSNIGKDTLFGFPIGTAATPKCLFPGTCKGGCPVYTFNGTGNWDLPCNWSENVMPPVVLPDCYEIVIDPVGNTECILNTSLQTISFGSKLTVMPGKKLRIPNSK